MSDRLGTEQQRDMQSPKHTPQHKINRKIKSAPQKDGQLSQADLRLAIINPLAASPDQILSLQRVVGNRAVNN